MLLQLGADVEAADGAKLGELHRIVFDPASAQVSSIVVLHNSLDGREVVVPLALLASGDDQAIDLTAEEAAFNALDDFESIQNVAPPPTADEVTSDLIDDPVDVPDVPPVGAATGVESIAFTPIVEENIRVPAGDQVLDSATKVWATDGEVGRLRAVEIAEETGEIRTVTAERGLVFRHHAVVPMEYVETVRTELIELSVPIERLETESGD